jgi:hypothetical protein
VAKIFPERLPVSVLDDPKRGGERKVYLALKGLPEKYTVFYSVHWVSHADNWGLSEGEADFVIAHPDLGVLILEVKGGAIQYKAEVNHWFSYDRSGQAYEIKDPVDQARRNHYRLLEQLKFLPGWPRRSLNIGHAVCFPDITLGNGEQFKPDLPREIILDSNDLNDIAASMSRMFAYQFGHRIPSDAPGPDRMRMIEGLLARSFTLKSPLGIELESEDEKLVQLTEQQFQALSLLGDRKRVAIAGCAGSGKTTLAVLKAQEFAGLGLNVLLVCFNSALADDLRKNIKNVTVQHFHGLCRYLADQMGIRVRLGTDSTYFDRVLPQALMDAAGKLGRTYDALIVDEGQDFQPAFWIAMEPLLKENGILYVFYDNNQNLYNGTIDFQGLIQEPPFILNRNCRNTIAIHKTVARFHNNPNGLVCNGPQGRPPELHSYHSENDQLRLLQRLLNHLVNEEHIDCRNITILTPLGEERTSLKPGLRLGTFTLSQHPSQNALTVQATSVYRFKGLERRVVILTEVDERTRVNTQMVMYVGCSRARTHLIILHDESLPLEMIAALQPGNKEG